MSFVMSTKEEQMKIRVNRTKAEMMLVDPSVPVTLGGMLVTPSKNSPVMATDGRNIFYNTSGLEGRLDGHIAFILAHESLHVLYVHHIRIISIWNKVKNGFFKDIVMTEKDCYRLYNIACDYVINGLLVKSIKPNSLIQLPDDLLIHDKYSDGSWDADSVFTDMVLTGHDPFPPDPPPKPGQSGEGEGEGEGESEGEGEGEGEAQSEAQGEGEAQSGDTGEQGGQGGTYPGDYGQVLPLPPELPPNLETDYSKQQQMNKEMERIQEIANRGAVLEKGVGKGSGGGWCEHILRHSNDRVKPLNQVQAFLKKSYSSSLSYQRPNKRFLQSGTYLPGRSQSNSVIHTCTDSSASVGTDEHQAFLGNIVRMAKDMRLNKIRMSYVDSRVHMNPKTKEPWFDVHLRDGRGADNLTAEVYGGGGTSFDPIFNYIKDNNVDVGCLIYFTDGYGSVSVPPVSYPVLWVTTGKKPRFYNKEFGQIVHI